MLGMEYSVGSSQIPVCPGLRGASFLDGGSHCKPYPERSYSQCNNVVSETAARNDTGCA